MSFSHAATVLRAFLRRRKQSDFAAEIESHIAIETERLEQEGLPRSEAERKARLKFGNVLRTQERFYESRRILWFDDILKDLRYALRTVHHSPLFAATIVLTLTLGIGATVAIFSITDAALIRPLPFPQTQKLFMLFERWQGSLGNLAPADYLDYRSMSNSFETLAAYRDQSFNIGGQGRPERVVGAVVTPDFFDVFRVSPQLGRTLDPMRDKPGGPRTAVLADSFWKHRYGASSDVIGRTISVNGEPIQIVGVMPPAFKFPEDAGIWLAARYRVPEHLLRPLVDMSDDRGSHYFDIVGRLKSGVNLREAQSEMDVIGRRLKQQYKGLEEGDGPALISLRDHLVGETRPVIFTLLAAVGMLFLIACANVANLVLARGTARRKELAVREALGAGRWRIVRQLVVENLLLSLTAASLGLGGTFYALKWLGTLLPVDLLPPGGLSIDLRLVIFAIVISVFSTILFGLFPAVQAAKVEISDALKEGGRSFSAGAHAYRTRRILAATQIALAAVLLIGAGLLIRSLNRLLSAPQGFSPDHVLSLQLSLPPAQYRNPDEQTRFCKVLLERIRSTPGVRFAGIASRLPLSPGGSQRGIEIKGRPPAPEGDLSPSYLVVTPDYFRTLQIPLLEGRAFTDRDTANAPGVVIVNQAMARHFWPGENPVGKYLRGYFRRTGDEKDWSVVVGVVADVAQQELDKASRPAMFVPYAQDTWPNLGVVARTAMDPKYAEPALIAAVHQVDKDEPVYDVRTMYEVVDASLHVRRFRMLLMSLFAGLALALAGVGIYGAMAYMVEQRSQEMGIRLALGASPHRVRLMILGEGVKLAGWGIAVGLIASLFLTRFLSSTLYGVHSLDPLTFAGAFSFLAAAALLASYVPARSTARLDTATILRSE